MVRDRHERPRRHARRRPRRAGDPSTHPAPSELSARPHAPRARICDQCRRRRSGPSGRHAGPRRPVARAPRAGRRAPASVRGAVVKATAQRSRVRARRRRFVRLHPPACRRRPCGPLWQVLRCRSLRSPPRCQSPASPPSPTPCPSTTVRQSGQQSARFTPRSRSLSPRSTPHSEPDFAGLPGHSAEGASLAPIRIGAPVGLRPLRRRVSR